MLSLLSDLFIFSPKAGGQTVDQTDLGDDEEETGFTVFIKC